SIDGDVCSVVTRGVLSQWRRVALADEGAPVVGVGVLGLHGQLGLAQRLGPALAETPERTGLGAIPTLVPPTPAFLPRRQAGRPPGTGPVTGPATLAVTLPRPGRLVTRVASRRRFEPRIAGALCLRRGASRAGESPPPPSRNCSPGDGGGGTNEA